MIVKTRFAPSPTGYIHLGNARTAILSALACRTHGDCSSPTAPQSPHEKQCGTFLLRIEDTDRERSQEHYIDGVCEDFQTLGLVWDEGERMGGEFSPYRQSERLEIYQQYFDKLVELGYAYHCFCTQDDLVKMRREQKLSGMPPRYDGRCSRLDSTVKQQRLADKVPFVLRFNTKFNHHVDDEIIFTDIVKGKQRFPRHEIGDFIIRKEDGMPTFFFSNAVDDSLMDVTHVLRGDDHLTNTPRQIMLLEALELELPKYAHLATVMGEDGTPLSKRNGSRSIRELITEGWLPLAIMNYLGRLGHYYASDELLSVEELGAQFKLANLGKSATKFDWSLLAHWQRKALMTMDAQELWQWLGGKVKNQIPQEHQLLFAKTIATNILLPEEALSYIAVISQEEWELDEQQISILEQVQEGFFEEALSTYQQDGNFAAITKNIKARCGCKGKQLFQPLRIALTGANHGPEMGPLLQLIPHDLVLKRLRRWISDAQISVEKIASS